MIMLGLISMLLQIDDAVSHLCRHCPALLSDKPSAIHCLVHPFAAKHLNSNMRV